MNTLGGIGNSIRDGSMRGILRPNVGLFLECKVPDGKKFFEGECIPSVSTLQSLFMDLDDDHYPHAWRGATICFVFGLGLLVNIITESPLLYLICVVYLRKVTYTHW